MQTNTLIDYINGNEGVTVMFWLRRSGLPVSVMLELEDELNRSVLSKIDADKDDNSLAKELGLEVIFTEDFEMSDGIEAELTPPVHDGYNGLIRIRKSLQNSPFAFTHEIMHYVFDVGVGNIVQNTFARKARGISKSEHEQRIDYQAAANRMRYDRMVEEISRYDNSSPKMNPVIFVNHLCTTYGVDRTSAVRRVQEVRAIKARKSF